MATIKWAVTTEGTFDFNDPSNWQFGTVPGAFDIAQFDQPVFNTVTGNATVAELLITQGSIDLTGSYTMSGAQPTELAAAHKADRFTAFSGAARPANSMHVIFGVVWQFIVEDNL